MVNSKTQKTQLIAFLESDSDRKLLDKLLKEQGLKTYQIIPGGLKEAIEYFSKNRSSKYLIIDISKSELPVSDLNKLADVCEPDISVIAVGKRNDVGLYRDLMKLGILEYVVKPLLPDIVGRALRSMLGEEDDRKEKPKQGKIIAVSGARGGLGSTLLSVNLASILSTERARRVVVVDMDFQFGTVSLYTNVKTNFGLRSALEDPGRLDSVFLDRLLVPVNERYSILCTEEPLDEVPDFKIECIDQLLDYLSKIFHYVIVDLPHSTNEFKRIVFNRAQLMLLLTDLSLAGLRDTGRLIRLFGKQGVDRRLFVIMNKFIKGDKDALSIEDFENSLKHKVNHIIAYDPILPKKLSDEGHMILNTQGTFADSLRAIVDDIQGNVAEKSKESFVEKIIRWLKFK